MRTMPAWMRNALAVIGYAAMFYALFQTAHVFWYLPAGLRFAALMLSPYRRWPWLLGTEVLIFGAIYPSFLADQGGHALAVLAATPLLAAAGPCWLRSSSTWTGQLDSLAAMARLLTALALAAAGATLANLAFPFDEAAQLSPIQLGLQLLLGDYIGLLTLVPLVLLVTHNPPDTRTWRRWRVDIPCVLLPMLLLYFALVARADKAQVFFFSALLSLLPSIYFAVRSGWRGGTLALSTATTTVAFSGVFAGNASLSVEAQAFLAVAGSANLLLGASHDALHSHRRALQERNDGLLAANFRQERLAGQLREAAGRNLEMSEQLRRWITSELHDEIGQNLVALQTRVRLMERQAGLEGSELSVEVGRTLANTRRAVSGLMSSLRPAGLDELGLIAALREGAIRGMLDAAGIEFALSIDDRGGCIDRLDGNAQTAIYRIVQEAATNTARHAGAHAFDVRLRTRRAEHGCQILLAIADDGRGFGAGRRAGGIGLQGIRDRVLSLGGRLRLRSDPRGTRLNVRLRFTSGDDADKNFSYSR